MSFQPQRLDVRERTSHPFLPNRAEWAGIGWPFSDSHQQSLVREVHPIHFGWPSFTSERCAGHFAFQSGDFHGP